MSSIMPKSVDHVNQVGDGLAEQVFEAVHGLMHLYRAQRQRALDSAGQPLTHMEHKALGFFARRPLATHSDLVQHAGRDKGQIARLIAALRERGLLEAQPDPADRRNLRLQPTAAGRALQQAARRQARRVEAAAVAGLSEAECRELLALLQRLQANLEVER
jgi:DNA-binding MarR family transcriptional regulator